MFYVLPVIVKKAVIKKIALDNLFGCLPFSTSKFDGLKTYRGPAGAWDVGADFEN